MIAADKDLAGRQGGDESLEEVTDLVVGVAAEVENVGEVKAKRHPRVSVCATGDEHDGVKKDADVQQIGERIAAIGCPKHRQRNDDRKHLQHPGGAVVRPNSRQRKKRDE
jgi:hypothetical protein